MPCYPRQRGSASKILVAVIAVLALALGVLGGQHWFAGAQSPKVTPEGFPGTVLPHGKPLPAFELVDDQGRPFVPASLRDKWTLLFFGYTHCPDVCPTTLGTLKQAWDTLQQSRQGVDDVQVVFVSVDPERDSIEHLKAYVDYFDPAFVGVTGNADELQRFSRSLGAIYIKAKGSSEENYLVDHTAAIFLLNPNGEFAAVLSAPHEAQAIADAVNALRD